MGCPASFSVSPSPLLARLNELAQLEAGWMNGEGEKLAGSALNWARGFALMAGTETSAGVCAFPPLEGGVSLEYQAGKSRWSLEVMSDGSVELATLIQDQQPSYKSQEIEDQVSALTSLKEFLPVIPR